MFDITEKELKEDLQVVSIGHRKNFHKAVQHLKKFYSRNRLYSDSIKNKLIRFYEKHSHHLKIGGGKKDFDNFKPLHETIHEDKDEMSYRESPAIMNLNHDTNNNYLVDDKNDEFQLDIQEHDVDSSQNNNEKLFQQAKDKGKYSKLRKIYEKKFEDEEIILQKKTSPILTAQKEPKTTSKPEDQTSFFKKSFIFFN